ncbi:MAG: GNAT family N-acetyltransferase [Hyphomicrobiaceae bacterium]|nr:GNAT family N-acetyltransferase [Hyphomicrobiaceae bacterium]
MSAVIRSATSADARLVFDFIRKLAEYERLSHRVEACVSDISRDLFGADPKVFCEIAEWNGAPAGFALWFYTYSTFRGRHGIWLEDLFVDPHLRGNGIGKALMRHLAARCVAENLARFEWSVLDWNEPSIQFYRSIGATLMDEWTTCRLDDAALIELAKGSASP